MAAMTQSRSVVCQERLQRAELAIGNCQASMSAKQQEVNAANGTLANFKYRAAVDRRKVEDLQRVIDENNRALAEVKEHKEHLAKYYWVPGWNLYLAVRRHNDILEEPILAMRLRNLLDEKNATEASLRAEHVKHDALAEELRVMEWTIRDLKDSRTVLEENCKLYSARAMPSWEIANLADGSVWGCSYGVSVSSQIRNDVGHKLAVEVSTNEEPTIEEPTMEESTSWKRSLFAHSRLRGHKLLAVDKSASSSRSGDIYFKLLSIQAPLPPRHRLATVKEVTNNRGALFTAMPSWEIANLADGSVSGYRYGGPVSSQIRKDVGHKLAVEE